MSGTGRRRANVRQYSAEDQALTAISKEAENRLAAKRAARAEAREIRMKEIEKREREAEEKLNNEHHANKQSRPERTGSRRGSDDSSEGAGDGPLGGERELKKELRALEEKYKAAMMSSAQLDNEKQSLVYQVELLKDQLEEQAESQTELQREYKEKSRNLELTKRELQAAQLELKALREQNDYKDRLIAESGLVIVAAENGELSLEKNPDGTSSNGPVGTGAVLLSSEALDMLNKSAEGSLDDKVKALAAEKKKLVEEIMRLENLLDTEQSKQRKSDNASSVPQVNGPEMQLYEIQREASKQIHDYKFKLQKAEQDIATLEGMVGRLETQVKRYKTDAERAEGVEDELKQEKRKLQRELREAQTQVEELQNQNKHLTTRLDRIKQSRTALGIQ